ncbi:MAG: phytanoyl-CoA dioxygenase family protein [Planctomycetes bacterium]|nr:phytanoyl-CoA dioxygenase family protein [Planctomycetota bacterium]
MLTQAQIQEFDEKGYLKVGKVLADEEVEVLRAELARVMEEKTEKKPVLMRNLAKGAAGYDAAKEEVVVIQIVNIWQASPAFLSHARHPAITETAAQLCRTNLLRIWHDQIQFKLPRVGGSTHWHQDHPAWPTIQPADLISAWTALDDAEIDNGCMWMVPGSHRWGSQKGFLSSGPNFEPQHREPSRLPAGAKIVSEPLIVKKGEVGFHHCLTWHGSPNNRTERPRRAIAVHYMPAHIRYQPIGRHPMDPYVPPHIKEGDILQGDSFPVVYEKSA